MHCRNVVEKNIVCNLTKLQFLGGKISSAANERKSRQVAEYAKLSVLRFTGIVSLGVSNATQTPQTSARGGKFLKKTTYHYDMCYPEVQNATISIRTGYSKPHIAKKNKKLGYISKVF